MNTVSRYLAFVPLFLAHCANAGSVHVIVASGATDEIFVLNAMSGAIEITIPLDPRRAETDQPHGLAVSPDGQFLYATVAHGEPTLWKFSLPSYRIVGRTTLETFGAGRIAVSPDGRWGYVTDYYRDGGGNPSYVSKVQLKDMVAQINQLTCPAPHGADVAPDGATVAITCVLSDEIVLLNAETLAPTVRFPVDSTVGPPGTPVHRPMNVAWHPDGESIWVTLHSSGALVRFSRTGERMETWAVGRGPTQLAVSADGETVVTVNRQGASISVLRFETAPQITELSVAAVYPHGIALIPGGQRAVISFEGTPAGEAGGALVIDLVSGTEVWRQEMGHYNLGVAVAPNGTNE